MIKASELRIGNYVHDGFGYRHTVEHRLIKDIVEGTYVEPIPLTEGWLIKFGFEKRHSIFNWYNLNPIDFRISKKGNFRLSLWGNQNDRILKNLKYVHQLQNLYFSLMGEELTIK